jgi:hypothetical protein
MGLIGKCEGGALHGASCFGDDDKAKILKIVQYSDFNILNIPGH